MASGIDSSALVGLDAFPTLAKTGVAYLDSAATSQTPLGVIEAMDSYYREAHTEAPAAA